MSLNPLTSTTRLSNATVGGLEGNVDFPAYDRSPDQVGILHFGPGAFHRAHQAAYLDDALNLGDSGWGICGVSLRSTYTRDRLLEQDCLYSLAIRDTESRVKVIGSIFEVLAAKDQQESVLKKLQDPRTRIVSLTITEKGYCLTPAGDLDTSHPDIIHDLSAPGSPKSAIGYIVEGYRRKREQGLRAFTSLSCDNLVGNGDRLSRAVIQLAKMNDNYLADWISEHACFPNTMVDSITPAADDQLLASVSEQLGLEDAVPVQREAFRQWVIEDRFSDGRPRFEDVGVTLTKNVAPFEQAKLRILNGLHSTLAFLGLLSGYTSVSEAMADPGIRKFLQLMVKEEILESLEMQDLKRYVDSIFSRFENPAISYNLLQIAGDSSQKLLFRIMGTVNDNLSAGRPVERLAVCMAAWLHFARKQAAAGQTLNDPLDADIRKSASECTGNAEHDLSVFSRLETPFIPELMSAGRFRSALHRAYEAIEEDRLSDLLAGVSRQ